MPSPSYSQNKEHIYKWVEKNRKQNNTIKLRSYYKMKIKDPIWRDVFYEYLDILI